MAEPKPFGLHGRAIITNQERVAEAHHCALYSHPVSAIGKGGVMLKRWMIVVALGLVLPLTGCATLPAPEMTDDHTLADPYVDWRPIVENARDERRCEDFARFLYAVHEAQFIGATDYVEDLANADYCDESHQYLVENVIADLEILTLEGGRKSAFSRRRLRDRYGLPFSSSLFVTDLAETGVQMPPDIRRQEREWLIRCERPMDIVTGYPYFLRRAFAIWLDDEFFLIPEWEGRREECIERGTKLLQEYDQFQIELGDVAAASVIGDIRYTLSFHVRRLQE